MTRLSPHLFRSWVLVSGLSLGFGAAAQDAAGDKFYAVIGGKVDTRTYNGFRRYHAGCNHCHGQDGLGSTFAPSLVDRLADIEAFRRIVREGVGSGPSVMKGFADDPNIAPYVDDIYAYLQARADSALGRGRPSQLDHFRRCARLSSLICSVALTSDLRDCVRENIAGGCLDCYRASPVRDYTVGDQARGWPP